MKHSYQAYTKYTAYFDNIEIMWIRDTTNNNGPIISAICRQISEQYYIWQWLGAQWQYTEPLADSTLILLINDAQETQLYIPNGNAYHNGKCIGYH